MPFPHLRHLTRRNVVNPPSSIGPHAREPSLPEAFATIKVASHDAGWMRRFLPFIGPGYLVAVGYMDPGNWATDLEGGAKYGYDLLFVILLSNLIAVLLQALSSRLGIVTGRDLAQACRDHFHPLINIFLWITCEIAIIACDLSEVIGTAIALLLLFHIPFIWAVSLTIADTLLLLMLLRCGFRYLEALVMALMGVIALCFIGEIIAASPSVHGIIAGFMPHKEIVLNPNMLFIAIGIIGATVMPHNLYLHSSIVQTRAINATIEGKRDAMRWSTLDSTLALTLALFVNAAILIVAASAFHFSGHQEVAEISDAFYLLTPTLGVGLASTLFALALLAAGTNSTITGTLAGQIVMEGFLNLHLPQWLRRLLTRGLAIIPVLFVASFYGASGVGHLLLLSQVILSMQLPFAIIPLIIFVTDNTKLGEFSLKRPMKVLSWGIALLLSALNCKLIIDALF